MRSLHKDSYQNVSGKITGKNIYKYDEKGNRVKFTASKKKLLLAKQDLSQPRKRLASSLTGTD